MLAVGGFVGSVCPLCSRLSPVGSREFSFLQVGVSTLQVLVSTLQAHLSKVQDGFSIRASLNNGVFRCRAILIGKS